MATGIEGTLGELLQWNYYHYTPYNEGSCGKVRGSAGELFPPPTRTNIEFFSPDMCRFVKLDYEEDVRIGNILGYKFSSGPSMLDNGVTLDVMVFMIVEYRNNIILGTEVPENSCFCNGECIPSGVINVTACRYGSPAFVSLPHFYGADEYYTDIVQGLLPERNKHEFFITLEPVSTGIIAISICTGTTLLSSCIGCLCQTNAQTI